jgi:hypothetical protein
MRWSVAFLGLCLLPFLGSPVTAQAISPAARVGPAPSFSVGGFLGYQRGLGFQLLGTVRDFATGFPLEARLRIGHTSLDPGDAARARRVFINDATNGTPEEAGRTWDFGLDGLYPLGPRTKFFGGLRYARFKANFNFVGGNENFDITSSHWGLAAGVEASYPMGRKTSLIVAGAGEYFFSSRITGHDTSYSPDGDNVNPRQDYGYSDADKAVGQPTWRPVALVGVSYRLGM